MKTIKSNHKIILLTILLTFIFIRSNAQFNMPNMQSGKTNYETTITDKASVEFNCSKDKIIIKNSSKYRGGGLFVVQVCDSTVYYECMGTVCQTRCKYKEKASLPVTEAEMTGKYHELVINRASVEYNCPVREIKQIKHFDGSGQGLYVLSVCGKEVSYECMGSVCNLKCE